MTASREMSVSRQNGDKGHKESIRIERQRYVGAINAQRPATDLYKIPISRRSPSSRIHMPRAPTFASRRARSRKMLDVIMLAIAFVFFAVSIAYVYACDQL
jgi:hypothetical protein